MRIPPEPTPEAGFTLVEIMIASGIAFVLAYFMATLLYQNQKQQKAAETRAANASAVQNAALDLRLKPVSP